LALFLNGFAIYYLDMDLCSRVLTCRITLSTSYIEITLSSSVRFCCIVYIAEYQQLSSLIVSQQIAFAGNISIPQNETDSSTILTLFSLI